jgi:tRNA-dihydrouridine synthase
VAILLCELGVDGIDLNMGCPAKSVANGGAGAGLIRTPELAQRLVQETKAGVQDWCNGATLDDCPAIPPHIAIHAAVLRDALRPLEGSCLRHPIPVSVKTRIGYETPVVDVWIPRLLAAEPAVISLHGRTLRQGYKGQADWAEIARAAELSKGSETLIFGNGDIPSAADGRRRARQYGLDGVLIGRAAFGNPFVFQQEDEPTTAPPGRMIQMALEHALLYEKTFCRYERYRFLPMRKHLSWYVKSIRGASRLRAQLVETNGVREVTMRLRESGLLALP